MPLGEDYFRQAVRTPRLHRRQATRAFHYQAHSQGRIVLDALGLGGPATIISNACASGACAIGQAWELIRGGAAEKVFTGGYDVLSQLVFSGFDALQALSPTRCRPFDKNRDGLAVGEGAAMLALETLESARQRNADILGEIIGYATTIDRHHLTQPHPEGNAAFAAMSQACAVAGITPAEIDYVNAHGTGTLLNDGAETAAINQWAGARAATLPVSSTKAGIGHLLGGAGAVEAVVCLMALRGQWLPPELALDNARPGVPVSPRHATAGCACEHGAFQFLRLRRHQRHLDFTEMGMSRIFVSGYGAVSPAGWSAAELQKILADGKSLPIQPLERPGWEKRLRTRAVPAPAARPAFLAHPRLRRSSPITHYAAGALLESLARLKPDSSRRVGLVVCLQSGCVQYTYRFFEEALADPATASPLLFPETVFAAPASHLAALLENTPLVSTLIGDPATFAQGLALGADWLRQNRVDIAVVVGAEEINWLRADALWHLEHAAIISGGAGAVALCRDAEFPPAWNCPPSQNRKVIPPIKAAFKPPARCAKNSVRLKTNCFATAWATARAPTRRKSPRGRTGLARG